MTASSATSPITRLKRLASKEKEDIVLLLFLILGYGLLTIAMPLAVQTLVNNVVIGGVMQPLIVVSIILLALLLISSIIYLTEVYLVEIIQRRIFVRSAFRIASNINGVSLSAYDNQNPVELMNRFFDVMTIQKSAATLLTVALTALLQGLIGSIILLFYSVYFAGALLVVILVLAWIVFVLGKSAQYTAIKESTGKYKMAAWLESLAKSPILAKFFNARDRTEKTTDEIATEYLNAREKHFGILMKQHIGVFTMYTLMGTGILFMSGLLVIEGNMNIGQFVAAELIIFGVLASFVRFVTKLGTLYDLLAALDKVGQLFDLPQEGNKTQHGIDKINHLHVSGVVMRDVQNKSDLDQLEFDLRQNQSLAIIGESGTGKTILAALLTGLRKFSQGTIQYNGVDIRQIHLNSLRDQIALVDHVELIDGSILDNLTLFNPSVGLDKVNSCLKAAGLVRVIHDLPNGIDTHLNALGRPLTNQQLHLLMLVRVLLTDSTMLIIDGLLDKLDEHALVKAIEYIKGMQADKMTIVMTRKQLVAKHFGQQLSLERMG